jgi:hypothetical protein
MLIVFAAAVWLAAGAGVASVGMTASPNPWTFGTTMAFLIIYVLFLIMFLAISRKHIRRIRSYTEELIGMFKFFDPPSYIILAVMIVVGTSVRLSGLVPGAVIASLYSGIGLALITAAVYYAVTYVAICDELVVK